MADEPWPKDELIPHDHAHAIGTITVYYNQIERLFPELIGFYLGKSSTAVSNVLHHLHNQARVDLLRELVPLEPDDDVREHLAHAIQCFNLCIENRNILQHAVLVHHEAGQIKATKRASGKTKEVELLLSLQTLRKTADEMRAVLFYIIDVASFLLLRKVRGTRGEFKSPYLIPAAQQPLSLPDKPLQPSKLSLHQLP
jgi:hypothetical protein